VKFLLYSNAPTAATGYGVQARLLADRLSAAGHQVAIQCTWGHQVRIIDWQSPSGHKVRLYPSGKLDNSVDVIHANAEHWFEADPEAGWIIPIIDVFVLANHPTLKEWRIAAWTPVDHLPAPPEVLRFFHNTRATPIAMSRFGQQMLGQAGLDPIYVPLAVDTSVYKPTFKLDVDGDTVTARQLFRIPDGAFVVGMVAMNKGWSKDRKGFNEAFRAFGEFWKTHQHAVLFVHSDQRGVCQGINLTELATHAAIPPHALIWTDQYAYEIGLPPEMMAAAYTAMDVLLAPSHGEGFCVPLIEAQACGTPVIVSDFSAQPELVGAGWKVRGQAEWDPTQSASYLQPFTHDVLAKLHEAHDADLEAMQQQAIEFAARYDVDRVFDEFWLPALAELDPPPPEPKPVMTAVDVIVPLMRPENMDRLMMSIGRDSAVKVLVVHDGLDVSGYPVQSIDTRCDLTSYAEKVNFALEHSTAEWVLVVGDDVEFADGWFTAAIEASTRGDVIGTNDSEEGRVRNPDVAAGRHADHFFIRRSYIDDIGSSLDGPGVAMPTSYKHWYVDREVIQLARARKVYVHAPDCRIIHHHPGYDGDEAARMADPTYASAVDAAEHDEREFLSRAPMIEAHRVAAGAR
jgi:glycosyltransferase involved in cell wall biosynthesis